MTTATREIVDKLLALQAHDLEILVLQRELDDAPVRLEGFQEQLDAVDQKAKAFQDRVAVLRAQIKLRENELKSVEQKIERLKVQSSEVKTNKEFVAFRSEMANYQGDADRLQGEILKILDVVEQAGKRVDELKEERAKIDEKVAAARARVDGELSGVRERRDALLARRGEFTEGIPSEPLQLYERVRRVRGDAVARMEGEYCSGCMEHLTRNEVISIQNAARLVQCRGCQRILASAS